MQRIEQIHSLIEAEMAGLPVQEHDPSQGLPLQVVSFGAAEVNAAMDCLISTWVTMGAQVQAFESEWAQWCGAEHGVMCNSGSSANLLMLGALVETGRLQPGDEVLVPAVAWSTSLFPVEQCGLTPVLVDVDADTLCISPSAAAAALTPRTKAALAVHMLGQPAPVGALQDLGLLVVEDACPAPGAGIDGLGRAGAMGTAGSFSFFFSHHITTVEGGIVVCQDRDLADAMRSLRAHGWVRERSDKDALIAQSPEIDPRFLFVSRGWNLRPTEMAGAMGRIQLQRLEPWLERRRTNHREWNALLAHLAPKVQTLPLHAGQTHAAFAYPLILAPGIDRARVMAHLESRKISTRPISGSNLARQPAFERVPGARVSGALPVSDTVHERGFFVGNSHAFHLGHGRLLLAALEEIL
ncbi:MAG: DegT/DnrJ/EryC1/StrS family aminotransferase [Myxococcota bacterium]|nr:DegT/DnrJ/EryC1/StrS family aminotransferase [Myxococcota bacterium]